MKVVELHPSPADKFDEFWKAYPKRIGKPIARAKWTSITNGGLKTRTLDRDSGTYVEIQLQASPEELIEAAKKYYEKWRVTGLGKFGFKDDGKYICHPATWLNQGRWQDD